MNSKDKFQRKIERLMHVDDYLDGIVGDYHGDEYQEKTRELLSTDPNTLEFIGNLVDAGRIMYQDCRSQRDLHYIAKRTACAAIVGYNAYLKDAIEMAGSSPFSTEDERVDAIRDIQVFTYWEVIGDFEAMSYRGEI